MTDRLLESASAVLKSHEEHEFYLYLLLNNVQGTFILFFLQKAEKRKDNALKHVLITPHL